MSAAANIAGAANIVSGAVFASVAAWLWFFELRPTRGGRWLAIAFTALAACQGITAGAILHGALRC